MDSWSLILTSNEYITKACPCNVQRFFSAVEIENSIRKILIFFFFFFFFFFFAQNIDCGYTLERVPTMYALDQKKK